MKIIFVGEIEGKNTFIQEPNLKGGKDVTWTPNNSDGTYLVDIIASFIEICHEEMNIERLYFVPLPGYAMDAKLEYLKIESKVRQEADLLLFFETDLRGGISTCVGSRHIVSAGVIKLLDLDYNIFCIHLVYLNF